MATRADFADGRAYNEAVTAEFRAKGEVSGDFAGRDMIILTTIGAKSGRPHVTPLGYTVLDGRMLVSAGAGGAPKNPAWYYNLVANPEVTVELPGDTYQARATVMPPEERDPIAAKRYLTNAGFKRNSDAAPNRKIPLIWLDRIS
jgi:deazaflavin-dependent oxidoreductase (nitroreductase family)